MVQDSLNPNIKFLGEKLTGSLNIFLLLLHTASYLNLLRTPFLESRLVNPGEMTHKKTIALTGDNCFCPTRTSSGRQRWRPDYVRVGQKQLSPVRAIVLLHKEKIEKMPIKSVKVKISKNKTMRFFMSQESLNQKIRFLAQKLWSVPRVHRQTDRHESEYRGNPFRLSECVPSNLSSRIGPIMNQLI